MTYWRAFMTVIAIQVGPKRISIELSYYVQQEENVAYVFSAIGPNRSIVHFGYLEDHFMSCDKSDLCIFPWVTFLNGSIRTNYI